MRTDDDRDQFQDPGGEPDRLTPADVRHGYHCDECAINDEGRY